MSIQNEMQREQFLRYVQEYIKSDPEAAAHISTYVQAGLRQALQEANQRAADMETALAIMASKRYRRMEHVIVEKLELWNGKTALNWDSLISQLKETQ